MKPTTVAATLIASGMCLGVCDTAVGAVDVELTLAAVAGAERCAEGLELHATQAAVDREQGERSVTVAVPRLPARLRLPIDPAEAWALDVVARGCWSPSAVNSPGTGDGGTLELVVWPTAAVVGQIVVPAGAEPEGTLSARFASPSAESKTAVAAGERSCSREGSYFRCELPATRLDLRLALPGFAPHYLWDVPVEVAERRDLSILEMIPGASFAGRVEWTGEPAQVSVVLTPEVFGGAASATARRLESRTHSTGIDDRGRFQFVGLPAGSYVAVARAEGGAASPRIEGLEVAAGAEVYLDEPLSLRPPAAVQIFVSPAFDAELEPWRVRWERELAGSHHTELVASGQTAPDGSYELPAVDRGRYHLVIEDGRGSSLHRRAIEVAAAPMRVEVQILAVVVGGELTRGGEPTEGRIVLTSGSGERAELHADAQGRFSGTLAFEGRWQLEVLPAQGRRQRVFGTAVEVVRGEDGRAWLPIELPATRVSGVVENGEGEPVDRALLTAFRDDRMIAQAWGEEGRFEIIGLAPGPLEIRAESPEGFSALVEVEVDESAPDEPVTLVVHPSVRLPVEVRFQGLPVAGARVRYRAAEGRVDGELTSSPSGRAELLLPPGVEAVDLVVLAARLPTRIVRHRLSKAPERLRPLRIDLPDPAGTLLLPLDPQRRRIVFEGEVEILSHRILPPSGSGLPPGFDPATGVFELQIAPGHYRLCDDDSSRCTGGALFPGSRLDLRTGRQEAPGSPASTADLPRGPI